MKAAQDAIARSIESLNAIIVAAEGVFESLNLCVTAAVDVNPEVGQLRFGKLGGRWRLIIDHPGGGADPLQNCDLRTRRIALAMLPDLYQALYQTAWNVSRSIDQVVLDVEAFLATIPTSSPSTDEVP